MTSALEGGEWSAAHPGRTLSPEKTRYPLYRRLGGPRAGLDGRKISPPPGFDPRTVQSVVSRYTDWATRPTLVGCTIRIYYDAWTYEPQILAVVSYGILLWWKETGGEYFRTNIGNLQYILMDWPNIERWWDITRTLESWEMHTLYSEPLKE